MQSDILWKAAILTAIVFVAGIGMGAWLDVSRVGSVQGRLTDIDLQWNDVRLQSLYSGSSNGSVSCEAAIRANLDFNDKIYAEGQTIERYEEINRFDPDLIQQKKRYALLQFQFWLNSMDLKKRCAANYTVLTYFYSYYNKSVEMDQKLQSAVLLDVKNKCGNSVLLVPLPSDLDLTSIDLLKGTYGVSSAPSILVDDSKVLSGLQGLPQVEAAVKC